jgi:[CysO sulfur-carrier protein]-S-L-cysteine hydrolase
MSFVLPRPFYNQILAHLQAEYPLEACGILAGQAGAIVRVYPIANKLRSPIAYEMEPQQQLAAMLEIDEKGWEMTAVYHSHPQGPETPSQTDVAQAYYPDVMQLIVSLRQRSQPVARAFRIGNGRVTELEFVVQP